MASKSNLSHLAIPFLTGLFCALLVWGCEKPVERTAGIEIQSALDGKEFLAAQSLFETSKANLSPSDSLRFAGILGNAFFQTASSTAAFDQLLSDHLSELSDSQVVEVLGIQADNHLKAFTYKKASEVCDLLLGSYRHALQPQTALDYENLDKIFKGLQDLAPQQMHFLHEGAGRGVNLEIPFELDKVGLKRVPVQSAGHAADFVFDTGANFSTITTSTAQKMGVRTLAEGVEVKASTGIAVQTQFGVADSLFIGDILFENVVFIVVPDSELEFAPIDYAIQGIVGFPVISQMRLFTVENDNEAIVVHPGLPPLAAPNMVLNSLDMVLRAKSKQGEFPVFFDTGAKYTSFSHRFFHAHEEFVRSAGTPHTRTIGGAGGMLKYEVLTLYDYPISLAGKDMVLDSVDVSTDEQDGKYYFGSIGQDIIKKFNSMTIDFYNSRLSFE